MKKITNQFVCSVFFIFYFLFFSLEVKAQTVTITASNKTICAGSNTTLTANPSGGTQPYTYSWSPSAGLNCITCQTTVATPTATTTYVVNVKDAASLSTNVSIIITVIPKPIVAISSSTTSICPGRDVTLNASGGNIYTWSTAPVQTSSSIVVSPTTSTSYSVFVTNSNGCSNSASYSVTVAPPPKDSVTSTYTSICTGILNNTTLAASSTGAISYFWSPGGATSSSITIGNLTSTSSTTYTVVVTNASGCTKKDTIHLNVNSPPAAPQLSASSYTYCAGETVLPISVTNPSGLVVWSNANNPFVLICYLNCNPFTPPDSTASYYVAQGAALGCISNPTVVSIIINPLPVANAGNDITICSGHTAQLNAMGGGTYLWTPSTYLNNPALANPTSNPDSTITYILTVTDTNKCKSKDSVTVYVDANDSCGLHIYNVITPNGDERNDVWWIDGINSFPDNTVTIFNRWGDAVWRGDKYDNIKIVWHGQNESGQPLPAGTYYYVLNIKGKTLSGWVELIR